MNRFFDIFTPSCEQRDQLDRYADFLATWNERFNLVAASTLPDLWERHFLDSAQLLAFMPPAARTVLDMGSGAGFPGLVIAILDPERAVHLVEATGKKTAFLRHVTEELGLRNTHLHAQRLEDIKDLKADIITARALKPLPELLGLAQPFMRIGSIGLFLKGQKADLELTEAQKCWTFTCQKQQSLSDPSGSVLQITGLSKKRRPYVRPARKR